MQMDKRLMSNSGIQCVTIVQLKSNKAMHESFQIRRPIREHSTKTLNQTLKSICIIIQGEFDTKSVLMGHIVLCDFHASAVLIRDEQTSENK